MHDSVVLWNYPVHSHRRGQSPYLHGKWSCPHEAQLSWQAATPRSCRHAEDAAKPGAWGGSTRINRQHPLMANYR